MIRSLVLALLLGSALFAQMPKGIYAWWSRPQIARDLNLSPVQREQIRATVQQYRPHLLNVRAAVNQAEQALADQFNRNPVDPGKTNEAIERLVDARSDLTRTLTRLSLKLRLVLTEQQWEELQRRRPKPRNRSRAKLAQVHCVDLRRHHEIAFREPVNLVGVNLHVHLAPHQAQAGMVAFSFRHRSDAIYEIEPGFEVGKQKTLRDVMLFDDLPVRQLLGKRNQLRALQGRHASTARNAVFLGQLCHWISDVDSIALQRL